MKPSETGSSIFISRTGSLKGDWSGERDCIRSTVIWKHWNNMDIQDISARTATFAECGSISLFLRRTARLRGESFTPIITGSIRRQRIKRILKRLRHL